MLNWSSNFKKYQKVSNNYKTSKTISNILFIVVDLFKSKSAILSSPATRVGLIYININVFYPRKSNLTLPGPENLLKTWKTSKYRPKISISWPKSLDAKDY